MKHARTTATEPRIASAADADATHATSNSPHHVPPYCDRRLGARLIAARYGLQVSPRTLERWPVATRRVNGRSIMATDELFAAVESMLQAAPVIGGLPGNGAAPGFAPKPARLCN